MKCAVCGSVGHNKRTCTLSSKEKDVPRSEIRAALALADLLPPPNKFKERTTPLEDISSCQNIWKEPKDFYIKRKSRENTCSHCGGKGHNSRTCTAKTPKKDTNGRQCSLCGECGHNKRTCLLKLPEKKQKQCGNCGEFGHNSRTCPLKCQPCSDQVARSYCFSGMSAPQAVSMARILECESIYGETEEYPQLVESSPTQSKTEDITFANGETISIDLGVIS